MYKRVPSQTDGKRDDAVVGIQVDKLLGQHGCDKDPSRICEQHSIQHRQQQHTPHPGTIAGDDTIFIVKGVGVSNDEVIEGLRHVLPNIEY